MDQETVVKMLDKLIAEIVSIKNAIQIQSKPNSEVANRLQNGICLYCGEPLNDGSAGRPTRGVHARCYRKITRSKQSIEVHETMGLIGPASSGGRPPSDDLADELAKKLLEESNEKAAKDFKKNVLDPHRKSKKRSD